MRTGDSGQNTPLTSLPLSPIHVNCFVRTVTVRLPFFSGTAMPKASAQRLGLFDRYDKSIFASFHGIAHHCCH